MGNCCCKEDEVYTYDSSNYSSPGYDYSRLYADEKPRGNKDMCCIS